MKKLKRLILVLAILLVPVGAYAASEVYQLGVDGLACPFCAYGVEKQLAKLEGIERIETDIQNGLVLLFMKEGSTLSEAAIRDNGAIR